MEVRKDLSSASTILERLYEYSKVFLDNNHKHWSHLKNREDFDKIYDLPNEIKNSFESIYSTGKDIAVYMGPHLQEFNYPESYPTITSYIDTFTRNWVSITDDLKEISEKAKSYSDSVDNIPWSVRQMIILFDKQIELLETIQPLVDQLRTTDIYKLENPSTMDENSPIGKSKKDKRFFTFVKSGKGIISIIVLILTILVSIYALKDSESFQKDIVKIISIFNSKATLNTNKHDNENETKNSDISQSEDNNETIFENSEIVEDSTKVTSVNIEGDYIAGDKIENIENTQIETKSTTATKENVNKEICEDLRKKHQKLSNELKDIKDETAKTMIAKELNKLEEEIESKCNQ